MNKCLYGFTPRADCSNCNGSGIFVLHRHPDEPCAFCKNDAIRRGEIDGTITICGQSHVYVGGVRQGEESLAIRDVLEQQGASLDDLYANQPKNSLEVRLEQLVKDYAIEAEFGNDTPTRQPAHPSEQSGLRDLLTDLRHLARKLDLDFDQAVEGSAEVYDEECEQQD